jgi:hypothetical protein
MRKMMPMRHYFGRAKVFGFLLLLILAVIAAYLTYTTLN